MTLLASLAGRLLERQVTKRLEEWLSTTEPGLSASFTLFDGSLWSAICRACGENDLPRGFSFLQTTCLKCILNK